MASPKFYVKASSYSNINPYPTWKRDADYWEKDLSNNLFYMAGNIGIGYPIPAGGLVVNTTIGIGTSAPQAALDVSGNVYLRDGTAAAPILSFNTDTNTGFYRPGNDTLGFVTGGNERMRIDASGNIGIGTINPSAKLDISGDVIISGRTFLIGGYDERNVGESYPSTRLKWKSMTAAGLGGNTAMLGLDDISGTGIVVYDYQGGGNLWKIERPTGNMFVNGNVGIGTITPRAKLDINDTGAMIIPAGTTAQLPSVAVPGMMRFNMDTGKLQFYNQFGWISIGGVSALGGNTTTDLNGYRIHIFTSSATFSIYSGGNVETLVVAGGGGGGNGNGNGYESGGGGGGGLIYNSNFLIIPGNYNIVIGAGGGGSTNGGSTTFNIFTAIGGGAGGSYSVGGSGGSGGGGSHPGTAGGTGTIGQGNNGGTPPSGSRGAGGGGAGSIGNANGPGGNGLQLSISGTATYYSGGGGGVVAGSTVSGGLGGGGSAPGALNTNGGNATYYGSGGGAAYGQSSSYTGGTGSSGIVIIRYLL